MGFKVGKVEYVTPKEIESMFGASREAVRRAVRSGTLKAIRAAHRTFIKLEDARKWFEHFYRADMAARVRKRWEKEKAKKKRRKKEVASSDSGR